MVCQIWKVLWIEERVGRTSDVEFVWAKLLSPDSELVKISVKFPLTALVQVQSLWEEKSPTRSPLHWLKTCRMM